MVYFSIILTIFQKKTIKKKKGNKLEDVEITDKPKIKEHLLKCIDIKCFGATYAGETNVSIHGAVQINHGVNIWKENNIFSEQIKSPVATDDGDSMTTIGRSVKLQEGHYLHHFSVNPANSDYKLTASDIEKLKDGLCKGVTFYDSTSKAGTENELMLWIELKEDSKKVLPNLNALVTKESIDKVGGKVTFNFTKVNEALKKYSDDIEKVEIYYNKDTTSIIGLDNEDKKKYIEYDLNDVKLTEEVNQETES